MTDIFPSLNILYSSFLFVIYVCILFTYIFNLLRSTRGDRGILLTWLLQFSRSTSLSLFFLSFLLQLMFSKYTDSAICSTFAFSLLFLFFLSCVTFTFLSRALPDYDFLLCVYTMADLQPPILSLFKNSPSALRLLARIVFSLRLVRLCTGFATSFLCLVFRVFLHLFRHSSSLTFSVHPFPCRLSHSSVTPFSICVCLRVL